MNIHHLAPWHKASFSRLLQERLPELLAARLPLGGYSVAEEGAFRCRITLVLSTRAGDISLDFPGIPQPDDAGVFELAGVPHTVVPLASSEELEVAEIRCAGEQLYDFIAARLGEAPAELPWDETVAHAWLPLDKWVCEFLQRVAQRLDTTNWLSMHAHLRRVVIPDIRRVITPGQFGRVCPFETPEGPNIGHVFSLARGAEIRNGRLIIIDDAPEAALGLTASMVPLLEQDDVNRLLFGVNMMRQWMKPLEPEPACVQTGNEPAVPDFWCGHNLLTAFISCGGLTYEDSILISESCARRLRYSTPVEPGDKFSNRHGSKGVVSRIVPDAEMPQLPDGTPVELAYSFIALHTRQNFGQIREAVLGRIARAEGTPALAPPFHAPAAEDLRTRLRAAGLPDDGMEQLAVNGEPLPCRSTVGWVYWGRTYHTAQDKLHACNDPKGRCQQLDELEFRALRDAGALAVIREEFHTCAAGETGADTLAARVSTGHVEPAPAPTPMFAEVARRLAVAGIQVDLRDARLTFRVADPEPAGITLARPLPHPWLHERELTALGHFPELPEFAALEKANAGLQRLLDGHAPASLVQKASGELASQVEDFLSALLPPAQLRFSAKVLFSGRTVAVPGLDLHLDQLGLAEEIAWTLYGPQVARALGEEAVRARSAQAEQLLDRIMADSWLIVYRMPAVIPTAFLAFHPVRTPDRTIHLHPGACMLMNADFDGDQLAVFLPLTEEAQREAGARLSIAGHLHRDQSLLKWLAPAQEALWGLAWLALTPAGLTQITDILGGEVNTAGGLFTRAELTEALRQVLQRDGIDRVLALTEQLIRLGLEVAGRSGVSLCPFPALGFPRPAAPASDDPRAWGAYAAEVAELLLTYTDYQPNLLGAQLLAVKSGARGHLRQLARFVSPFGPVPGFSETPPVSHINPDISPCEPSTSAPGETFVIRHSLNEGLTPPELFAAVSSWRKALQQTAIESMQIGYGVRPALSAGALTVLARARQSPHPGIVFARAAATGEVDPLADVESRLFVGV